MVYAGRDEAQTGKKAAACWLEHTERAVTLSSLRGNAFEGLLTTGHWSVLLPSQVSTSEPQLMMMLLAQGSYFEAISVKPLKIIIDGREKGNK